VHGVAGGNIEGLPGGAENSPSRGGGSRAGGFHDGGGGGYGGAGRPASNV
jgi:hypothetical protein